MDFVMGLPRTLKGFDAIWVIVDQLTKSTHVLLVKITYGFAQYTYVYIDEIVQLHGVLIFIILNYEPQFMVKFWKAFKETIETELDLNIAFHHQTKGQTKKIIYTLKDMLRRYVMDFGGR